MEYKFGKESEKEIEREEWKIAEIFKRLKIELQKEAQSILSKKKTVNLLLYRLIQFQSFQL